VSQARKTAARVAAAKDNAKNPDTPPPVVGALAVAAKVGAVRRADLEGGLALLAVAQTTLAWAEKHTNDCSRMGEDPGQDKDYNACIRGLALVTQLRDAHRNKELVGTWPVVSTSPEKAPDLTPLHGADASRAEAAKFNSFLVQAACNAPGRRDREQPESVPSSVPSDDDDDNSVVAYHPAPAKKAAAPLAHDSTILVSASEKALAQQNDKTLLGMEKQHLGVLALNEATREAMGRKFFLEPIIGISCVHMLVRRRVFTSGQWQTLPFAWNEYIGWITERLAFHRDVEVQNGYGRVAALVHQHQDDLDAQVETMTRPNYYLWFQRVDPEVRTEIWFLYTAFIGTRPSTANLMDAVWSRLIMAGSVRSKVWNNINGAVRTQDSPAGLAMWRDVPVEDQAATPAPLPRPLLTSVPLSVGPASPPAPNASGRASASKGQAQTGGGGGKHNDKASKGGGKPKGGDKGERVCAFCYKTGHIATQCSQYKGVPPTKEQLATAWKMQQSQK
jgi:hypothetical protein